MPPELEILRLIDRFGVKAVTGKDTLSAGDIRRMLAAENVVAARIEQNHGNHEKWARDYPEKALLIVWAERAKADEQ